MPNNQRGNILIWSLLVIMVSLGGVVFLSDVVISSLRAGHLTNDALQAWHLADAGAEYALYQIRHQENYDLTLPPTAVAGGQLTSALETEESLKIHLAPDTTYQLDLYDALPDQAVGRLYLQGSTTAGWLEAQIVSWQLGSTFPEDNFTQNLKGPTELNNGFFLDLPSNVGQYHRLTLKALYDDLTDLTISAYSIGGAPVPVPARLKLRLTGQYGRSSQEIVITTPRRAPLYGLFDYVVFSEKVITKN
ncbi:hypothetical protein HY933_01965 [Candidatus Falkowbacteria bacterium]|nr:hypothetical protein [Candidatus Falkowbacteria bacterium]